MKVVRIIARLNVGGPAKHVAWVSAGLRRLGCTSILVAGTVPPDEQDMTYFAVGLGVSPVILTDMSRELSLRDAVTIWKLVRLLWKERPDIVHTHTAKAGAVGRIAGLIYRWATPSALLVRPRACGLVHTFHGHVFHSYYGRQRSRLFVGIERILARVATDRIIVLSPRQRSEIHQEFHVGRAEQFRIVPLGLDTSVFAARPGRGQIMREELGIAGTDFVVGIVGRLTRIKNHELFLTAAAHYKSMRLYADHKHGAYPSAHPHVKFVVIGDGELRSRLEELVRILGLTLDVVFTGVRQDPENFYPALDVVALTSSNEGTPLTLLEAMANSRPVIATDVGGVADLLGAAVDVRAVEPPSATASSSSDIGQVGPGRAYSLRERGILVRPNDAVGFANGLARMITDGELRAVYGDRGRRFIDGAYSLDRLARELHGVYSDLLIEKQAGRARHGKGPKGLRSSR